MGASFTNCHVRSSDLRSCAKALSAVVSSRAFLTQPKKGWISIYGETYDAQELSELERVAKGLSRKLATDAIAFLLHDSDVFIYVAYRNGRLLDRFNSHPDYFGAVTANARRKWAGNPKNLVSLATRGISAVRIAAVLRKKHVFQEELIEEFARIMGIEASRACVGFRDVVQAPGKLTPIFGRGHSPKDAELIRSSEEGNIVKVRDLLSRGASPNLRSRMREPLLSTAISFHKVEIAMALLDAGADPFSAPENNAIWAAAAHNERGILTRLLRSPSEKLRACFPSALMSAIQMGHVDIVRDLLMAGADPNGDGESKLTPLMSASFRGLQLVWEIWAGQDHPGNKTDWASIVTALLEAGANVNAQSEGVTALMVARASGQKEIIQILEKAGADPT